MKVNSAGLYDLINQKNIKPNTKINVYLDDIYKTQIIFDGECFNWTSGTFDSSYFFNPLVDFEIMEEEKKLEKINETIAYSDNTYTYSWTRKEKILVNKINELIDKIKDFMEVNNESK